jgi:hypothetical protein
MGEESNPAIQEWKRRYEHEIIDDAAIPRWNLLTKARRRRGDSVRDHASRGTSPRASSARRDH